LTVCNTSSFLNAIGFNCFFSMLLQHHISKLSRSFWSAFQSVQAVLQM
jgi:hypothetical protein